MPPVGPGDHVRGTGAETIIYLDLACPRCAGAWARVRELELRVCVRHFPLASKRPRSPALHAAAEAGALHSEEAFWVIWDSLLDDRGRVDDPHLWERARVAGIEVDRFDRDRRSSAVAERVARDFRSGIRAGVTATPTAFAGGRLLTGEVVATLTGLASGE